MGTVRFRRKLLAGIFPMGQGVQGFRPEAFSLREILPETKFISWTLTKNLNRVGSKEKRAWGSCRLVMRIISFRHGAFYFRHAAHAVWSWGVFISSWGVSPPPMGRSDSLPSLIHHGAVESLCVHWFSPFCRFGWLCCVCASHFAICR